ncbi:MAG: hypothetical protein E8A46_09030 [Bradyrhizobium sp.]|uniref:hypothetical protein n=1 Tax=Bradyrhizobium sp. TaxID=376 RepID=UPI0012089844|nr:hypothetical protein [Bradyrhizobium sp.]THD54173.1 MAG: hypothetical protein E8A46_09030 [Bradyrhizobium sp.]
MSDGREEKPKKHEAVWLKINGSIDIGVIDVTASKAIGFPAGPIRLAEGLPGPKGYGLAHIDRDRASRLKDIGFEAVQACFVDVAANWEAAVCANETNKVVLVKKHRARVLQLVAQIFDGPNGHYWSATTIIIGRRIRPDEVIYQRIITAG